VSGRLRALQACMQAHSGIDCWLQRSAVAVPASKISKRPSRPVVPTVVLTGPVGRSLSCALRLIVVGRAPQPA